MMLVSRAQQQRRRVHRAAGHDDCAGRDNGGGPGDHAFDTSGMAAGLVGEYSFNTSMCEQFDGTTGDRGSNTGHVGVRLGQRPAGESVAGCAPDTGTALA